MRFIALIAVLGFLLVGCSDKNPAMPQGDQTSTLSGQVLNQFHVPAPGLKIVVSDSQWATDSIVTDSTGAFSFPGIHNGLVGVHFVPTTSPVADLPRYLYAETILDVQRDTVVEFYVREFNEIFHDDGTHPEEWIMHGGVTHADSTYIFTDQPGQSDSMIMAEPVQLPQIDGPAFILLEGNAAPADRGLIRVRVISDGEYVGQPHNLVFATDTYSIYMHAAELDDRLGSMVRLDLTMQTTLDSVQYLAAEILLTGIWIFSY